MDAKGCTKGPAVININVTPPLLVSATSQTVCHLGAVFLAPIITSPGNGSINTFTYNWTPPVSGNQSTITVVVSAPVSAVTSTYGLTVSDGCTIPSAVTVFTLLTNPLPTATFTADVLEACAPKTINFN